MPDLELPFDILMLIMEASPQRTIVKMMYTCHAFRDAGARILVGRGVSLTTENITSFVLFMRADKGSRFQYLHVLEIASGKLPRWAANELLSLITHPSLALHSLTIRDADLMLTSKPSSSEPIPNGRPPLLVTALAGLTTLQHLTVDQCDQRACILVRTIRSPLKAISIGFIPDSGRTGDEVENQNPIVLLSKHSETLEEISGSNFTMHSGRLPYDAVYPSVRTINATYDKDWPPSTLAYVAAFPNLSRLSLTCPLAGVERRLGDGSVLESVLERRAWNKRSLEAHTPRRMWKDLEEVEGSVTDVLALGLGCHVRMLRLSGTPILRKAPEYQHIAAILEDTQPTGLAIAVAGASSFCDTMSNLLRNPFAQQLRTLEVELVFSPSEGDMNVQKVLVRSFTKRLQREEENPLTVLRQNDVAATLALLPLHRVTLTLNYGLLTAPDETYRPRYGWFCPVERDVEGLDVAATQRLFRVAIPSLVTDVVVHLSTDRTAHTSRLGVIGDSDHDP